MTFPTREQLIEAMEVSIAEKLHLIPNGTNWEDKSEMLAEAALNALITALPDPSYVYVSRMSSETVGDTYVITLLEKKVANFGEQYYKQLLAMGENNV